MGTLNAIYIRKIDDQTLPLIREQFKSAAIEHSSDFISVQLGDNNFDPPTETLKQIARDINTDVIWLGFQSVVDAFQFHHWKGPKHCRTLVYGCYGQEERTWERAEGTPEHWEDTAYFNPDEVKSALDCFDEDDKERAEYERVCRNKELVPGAIYPSLDARETARKVAEYYRLPGWGIEGIESTVLPAMRPIVPQTGEKSSAAKPWWKFW